MEKTQYKDILKKAPGSFMAKLERIRRFLYLGKASVMVGAGFSRNADTPSHVTVKEWAAVGKDIYCRLQNVPEPNSDDLVFKTPMRLASQFAASFGRSELDNLIRDSIPDNSLYPGEIHKKLLSLPWRDVFSTNYDTLLERSCDGLERTYSVITSKEMLLYKKSPRIVKLHGSFPDKTPFLMTEEDFRTYPQEHPEFVNTVRQAMVESIFCLIGFSGDDPNFISWQGWLRDVMGDYAGPSYLITCDENYDESFKVLMEQRGVDVLNFCEIEGISDHKSALDFFFTYLDEHESNWDGFVSYDVRSINIESLVSQMRDVRLAYPGWYILPKKYYGCFSDMEYSFPYLNTSIKTIENNLKEQFLYELDWRADKSFSFKDFDWYRESLESVISSYNEEPLSSEAITLGITLLRLYRHHFDKSLESGCLSKKLECELPRMTGHQVSRFFYVIVCNALSELDYEKAERLLLKWPTLPLCYEGIIYKSLVFSELGRTSDAVKLLSDAIERVTHSLSQNSNVYEQSLRHTMESLLSFNKKEKMPDVEKQFSFFDVRDYFVAKISEAKNKDFGIKTDGFGLKRNFGIGSESRTWNLSHGTRKDILFPYRLILLYEEFGLPFGTLQMPIDEKLFSQVLPYITDFGIGYYLGVMLRCGSRDVVNSCATRSAFNTLRREDADNIAKQLLERVPLLEKDTKYRRMETDVLLPFLSRLASSCSQSIVVSILKFANKAYRKSFNCKPEDLTLIYSSLFTTSIQEGFSIIFSSGIYRDLHERDVPLPSDGYEYYLPSDKDVSIVCEGLVSSDSKVRELAYYRAECLFESKLIDENKSQLEEAVRKWRANEQVSRLTRHSYSFVKASAEEMRGYEQCVKDDLKMFLEGDYTFSGSSVTITSFSENLHNVLLQSSSLSDEQKGNVLEKIAEVLSIDYDTYSKDDSGELMGGIRHFTSTTFLNIEYFVKRILHEGFCNVEPCVKLFQILEKYLSSNLPVRLTMERLNVMSRYIGPNSMREIITRDLYSDNRQAVIDSCNALIAFSTHYTSIQKVLQDLIFFCNHAETDRMSYYIQTLSLISPESMKEKTRKMLADLLKTVLERVPKQAISEEQKTHILHCGVKLAASLKNTNDPNILESIKLWEKYSTDESIYNDIRQPWYI